jgi:hypothetical protein
MIHPTAKASREPIAAAFSSQYDKRGWGTEGSNPSLPSGESAANLTLSDASPPSAVVICRRPKTCTERKFISIVSEPPRAGYLSAR